MRIDNDHMYHGAALIQIAEHPQFTAINSLKGEGAVVRTAYKINDEIVIYLKYSRKPTRTTHEEYPFTFDRAQLDELIKIEAANPRTFIALVCMKVREICFAYAVEGLKGWSSLIDRSRYFPVCLVIPVRV